MDIDLYRLLDENVILLVFLLLGIGFLLGNIRIGGMRVGSTIGVLLAGLFFGHFGLHLAPMVGSFGFALFIFSVGLQAGPSFFSVLREDGRKYLALSVLVAVLGLGTAVLLSQLVGFEVGLGAGMLAGALTSTPSLAGVQDAFASGLGNLGDDGVTVEQAIQNVNIGYAITYIGGAIGMILFVRYFPALLGVNLRKEAKNLARERGLLGRRKPGGTRKDNALPIIRAYQISADSVGKSLGQRAADFGHVGSPLRVKRGDRFLDPDPDLMLEQGDLVSIVAGLRAHRELQERVGQEVLDETLLNYRITSKEIVVLNRNAVGRALKERHLIEKYGCFATGMTRAGIELPISGYLTLNKGDRLQVTGEETRLHKLADDLGYVEEEVEETDLVTFSFGIAFGALLGLVVVKLGGISIGLGTVGGLLLAGILIGFASSLNPTFGRVPQAARFLLLELGLMLFMAGIGLNAGGGLIEALSSVGPAIILCGLVVTLVPAFGGYFFGRKVLRLNPALLLGSVTGAMTSTPALNILTDRAKSAVPALGYAGTYTIANVLLTFAGTAIAML